ncbi:MAG: hypothetical protein GXX95_10210 [Methanomassiliicoccus sp.]|nr:hypothetical protein [Methanomassiliicoccus sp.]
MPFGHDMRGAGITPAFERTTRMIRCPRCGQMFSLFQSRAIACQGCRKGAFGCQLARCIRCDHEFPLEGTLATDRVDQKLLADYINNVVATHNRNMGRSDSR